ncbi:MAG TPA: GntR family transcriptional regulator [Chthoniobacterales bacterium]
MESLQTSDSLSDSSSPKHRQIFEVLRSEILSGKYRPGEKLPSEAGLVKRFGASRITVGRAVRDLRDQDLIERRAGSGSYVRHVKTSGLTFGLLIPNLGQTDIFEPICQGMADAAQTGRHALLWGNAAEPGGDTGQAWRLCQQFIERRVSGVFFAPLELTADNNAVNRKIATALDKARIPVVLLDRCYMPYPHRSKYDLVGISNRQAGYIVTEHLLNLGVKRPSFVAYPHSAATVDARIVGFREALRAHDLAENINCIQTLRVDDAEAVRHLVETQNPDAIVAANDRTAGGLMQSLLAQGIRIPEDIRVVGIDDSGYSGMLPVPLTTVHQPCRDIGMAAMEAMLARLARPEMPTRDILLAAKLIVRRSCGAKSQQQQQTDKIVPVAA